MIGHYDLTGLVKEIKPKMVLSGHMHYEFISQIGSAKLFGLGYGIKGRYVLVDTQKLQVEFKTYFHDTKEEIIPRQLEPGNKEIFERVLKKGFTPKKLITVYKMMQWFNLKQEYLPDNMKDIFEQIMQEINNSYRIGKITTKKEAAVFAKTFLQKEGIIKCQ